MKLSALLIFAALTATATGQATSSSNNDQHVPPQFSKSAIKAHMRFLADDLLEGRGTGTRGQEIAAKYIAAQFEELGLEPGGTDGSYFQTVPLREITVDSSASEFSITSENGNSRLRWGEDFIMRGSELQEDASVEGAVVFVGFGVVNGGRNYDDYAGADVKGKIVAVLFGAPSSFPAEERAHFSSMRQKIAEAASRGAVGIITFRTEETERILPWPRTVIGAELPAFRWLDTKGTPNDSFPAIQCSATVAATAAERFFAGAAKPWGQVLRDAASSKPQSFPLAIQVRMHAVSRHRASSSPNVAAILRGSDRILEKEYVIYTAHSDHLGIGRAVNGDSIYNGAVDDASGIAALLEMATAFSRLRIPPARSILFVAVTAEEKGLLGSDYFAHFPTVPADSIIADLNMDGASVFYTFKDVVALGAEHSTLDRIVTREATKLGLQVSPDLMPEQASFTRGDQYSFVRQGIPSASIGEGLQSKDPDVDAKKFVENWIATRYHSPSDDMNQPLNFDATIQFMQINFLVGYDIAQQRERPVWKHGDFFGQLYGRKSTP